MGQYELDLHVLVFNHFSTEAEIINGYRSMARRFLPDNNFVFDTSEIMKMINTTKDGLQE